MARRPPRFDELMQAAELAREVLPPIYRAGDRPFAAADARVVHDELVKHAGPGRSFLEWGSGAGTITILADLLGFTAVGIEIDPLLIATARHLADRMDSRAQFEEGNFLPTSERNHLAADAFEDLHLSGRDAYASLGRKIDSFDLVYVFPWPDQVDLCHAIFARHARPAARLLVYSQTMDVLEAVKTADSCTPLVSA